MLSSEKRILTTQVGSLPRPAVLTTLFAKRIRGEAVDAPDIAAEGRAALRAVVKKQIETGLDVIAPRTGIRSRAPLRQRE